MSRNRARSISVWKVNDTISQLRSQAPIIMRARAAYDSCVNFIVIAPPAPPSHYLSLLQTSPFRVNVSASYERANAKGGLTYARVASEWFHGGERLHFREIGE